MNRSSSIFAAPFFSMTLIACSAAAIGCMASSEPDPTTDSAEETLINESGALSVPMQSEIRLERTAEGDSLSIAPSKAWKETAPGVWESEAQGGASRIVVGAEGHRSAIEQAEKDLSALYDQAALQADAEPAAIETIRQSEAHLKNLKDAAQSLAAVQGIAPLAVSCDISFYTGPSSPVLGTYGAAGLAQVSCSGGCQTFTISAQACTNFGCGPLSSASNSVCASPWLFGVAKDGTPGASCSSSASVSPPGITSSWTGSCG